MCSSYNDIIIDGKLYDVKSLHKSMDETISDYNFKGGTDHIYLELAKGIKFSDILNSTVNKELILKAYNIIAEYVDKNNAPGRFLVKEIINKLKICKSISFKQKDIGYVYECELTVGKLFTRALTPTDIHFIKGQMKRERINVDLFKEDPNAGYSYSSHFYDNLVRYYRKKRNNNSNYVDPVAERKASLFLHRCGYEAIQCGGGEYVVIDINCLKITNTIKV